MRQSIFCGRCATAHHCSAFTRLCTSNKGHYGDDSRVTVSYAEHNTTKDGEQMMKQYLEQHQQIPSHFIASSLPILEGLLSVIRQREGVIPAYLHIGTFDDHVMLSFYLIMCGQ